MTEGNIATWKVQEGDSFAAGDVLLEIETDKATMDVEAQDDGIMMKITQENGSKAVKVGTRIAVIAESGDDISALDMPPDEILAAPTTEETKPSSTPAPILRSKDNASNKGASNSPKKFMALQAYPLFPAVKQLMKQRGINESEIANMNPTGPKGRLLKGDVLAYLGYVDQSRPEEIRTLFDQRSHLDLSDIKVAETKAPSTKDESEKKNVGSAPSVEELQVTLSISLAPALEAQRRLKRTLGVEMPLSTFISRATDLANDSLPLPSDYKPSNKELFNEVLGIKNAPKSSRGHYLPRITAVHPAQAKVPATNFQKADIIDILAAPSFRKMNLNPRREMATAYTTGANVFTVVVPKKEEKRAQIFLERIKSVLEKEPGRLLI